MSHELDHLITNLAWTLIHFVWQGLALGATLKLLLPLMQKRRSEERYVLRCATLLALLAAPLATFLFLQSTGWALEFLPAVADPDAVLSSADSKQSQLAAALPWLVGMWLLGVTFLLLRLFGGCLQVARIRRRLPGTALAQRWQQRFERLAREFGVRATARVVECASITAPTVIGWLKPVVLIPAKLFTGFTDEQIVALLAHELAHVARRDYLVNIVQSIVEALLFYHPVVWWVSQGIREEREYCCDDRAVAATHDGLTYARALAALEAGRGAQPQLGVSTLGGSLMNRIQRMVGRTPDTHRALWPKQTLATVLAVGTLGVSAFGFASLTTPVDGQSCHCKCHGAQDSKQVSEGPHETNAFSQPGSNEFFFNHASKVAPQVDEPRSGHLYFERRGPGAVPTPDVPRRVRFGVPAPGQEHPHPEPPHAHGPDHPFGPGSPHPEHDLHVDVELEGSSHGGTFRLAPVTPSPFPHRLHSHQARGQGQASAPFPGNAPREPHEFLRKPAKVPFGHGSAHEANPFYSEGQNKVRFSAPRRDGHAPHLIRERQDGDSHRYQRRIPGMLETHEPHPHAPHPGLEPPHEPHGEPAPEPHFHGVHSFGEADAPSGSDHFLRIRHNHFRSEAPRAPAPFHSTSAPQPAAPATQPHTAHTKGTTPANDEFVIL